MSRVIFKYINFDGVAYQWLVVPIANVRKVERSTTTGISIDVTDDTDPRIVIDLDLHDLFDGKDSQPMLARAYDQLFVWMVSDLLGYSKIDDPVTGTFMSRVVDVDMLWTYDSRTVCEEADRETAAKNGATGWERQVCR